MIGTTLFAIAGVLLYVPAALGYFFLYYKYLPTLETSVPVHLQYGYVYLSSSWTPHRPSLLWVVQALTDNSVGPNPFGIASFKAIANRQAYDITVSLTLPRSPANLDRGNFMLALHLLSPGPTASDTVPIITTSKSVPYLLPARPLSDDPATEAPSSSSSSSSPSSSSWHSLDALLQPTRLDLPSFLASHSIVHTTARPALIPYVDPLASLASRILFLGYHLLAPRGAAALRLSVPMAEGLAFSVPRRDAARVLPDSLLLEVQAGQGIQVYDARVTLVARLRGLQGFMYRWRITAFVLFTAVFWGVEMVAMVVVLVVVGVTLGGRGKEEEGSDGEEEEGVGEEEEDEEEDEEGGEEIGGSGGSGGSEDDEGEDWGSEGRTALMEKGKDVVKDEESPFKTEVSSSSALAIKTEEEDTGEMANVPSFGTGSSTEADDEHEVKPEGGPEPRDLDTGTGSSSSQVREGIVRRRNLLSSEDVSAHGDGD